MIEFYIINSDTDIQTPEQTLARRMGKPPFEIRSIPASQTLSEFIEYQKNSLVGIIFDPNFWYSHDCWNYWVNAVLQDGADEKINVPLGNQHPAWREGLNIPAYQTLSGLERASAFKAETRWMIRKEARQENFCVVIVPMSVLNMLPKTLAIGEVAEYWAKYPPEYRIFCEGWLHSFTATKDSGGRHDLLKMCDWRGMVLELGCDIGLMAKTCKEQYPDVCWIGVDVNQNALLQADLFADMAICADIHSLPFSDTIKFDRIVCGDVLEHLPYPWEILKTLHKWLKPDGLLIVSVPNVGHWTIVQDLLSGRWDEVPAGILCVSHLRFGTKKNWEQWFHQSGWQIIRWECEKLPLPEYWKLQHPDYNVESLETIQYRFVAKQGKNQ